ncbi:MAG: hypothetical protein ACI959_002004, partial [Limisphaerales bacterium]
MAIFAVLRELYILLILALLASCGGPEPTKEEVLRLSWSDDENTELNSIRDGALAKGINTSSKWLDGRWELLSAKQIPDWKQSTGKVKFRIKGDWSDHILGDQWSFRLKLSGRGRWNGMKSFSIMRPEIRDYISEYVYHELLHSENVLAPRYSFGYVNINDKGTKLYAFEEHFRKELVESLGRREAPILKFEETELWNIRLTGNAKLESLPIAESADIVPFTPSNLEESETFKAQFITASGLLNALRQSDYPIENIIDVEAWAKFLAIVDLTEAYHSLIWHNLRFYYNPVTGLLEPVGYDGFNSEGVFNWLGRDNVVLNNPWNAPFLQRITNDSAFQVQHKFWLSKYTDPQFLDNFFSKLSSEIARYEGMIQYANSNYSYKKDNLYARAEMLRASLEKPIPHTSETTMWEDQIERRKS